MDPEVWCKSVYHINVGSSPNAPQSLERKEQDRSRRKHQSHWKSHWDLGEDSKQPLFGRHMQTIRW